MVPKDQPGEASRTIEYTKQLMDKVVDVVLAANHILFGLVALIAQGLDGFAQATESLTGQAIGARDRQRLSRVVWAGSFWGLLCAFLIGVALYKWGMLLLPYFSHDVDVLKVARDHFQWVAAAPLVAIWCFQLDGIYFGATRGTENDRRHDPDRCHAHAGLPVTLLAHRRGGDRGESCHSRAWRCDSRNNWRAAAVGYRGRSRHDRKTVQTTGRTGRWPALR